jgi:transposase-like protein
MPGPRSRVFSREFKETAVRRIRSGEKVKALAAELQVWPKLLYHWWNRYERGGPEALLPPGRPRGSAARAEGPRPTPRAQSRKAGTKAKRKRRASADATEPERVAELERKIGQQALELIFSREPCGTSRRQPGRATGVAPGRLRRDRGDDAAARPVVDRGPVCPGRREPGDVLPAVARGGAPGPRRRRFAMCSSGWPSTIGTTGIDASLRSYGAMAGR